MFQLTNYYFIYLYLALIASFGVTGNEEKPISAKDTFKLHSGDLMPLVGFGTFTVKGDDHVLKILDYVIGAGYRLIDSAQAYGNEESIGKALKVLLPKYNLTRKDIFITTKLMPSLLGSDDVYASIEKSIQNLGFHYLDLFLIHFPGYVNLNVTNKSQKNDSVLRDETWQVLTKAVKQGLIRNIGVSNYNVRHLSELLKNDHGVKPAVNQVEWHPAYHQPELLQLCKQENILLQAYFSLGGTEKGQTLLSRPEVIKIAEKLEKTPAQVLLRWALQQKIGIIPKASSEARIKQNLDIDFTIPEEDMKVLFNVEQKQLAWNPNTVQ